MVAFVVGASVVVEFVGSRVVDVVEVVVLDVVGGAVKETDATRARSVVAECFVTPPLQVPIATRTLRDSEEDSPIAVGSNRT